MFNLIYFFGAIIEPLVIIVFTLVLSILFFGKDKKIHHSHWNTLLENFDFSTKEFYQLLQSELESKGIEGLRIKEINFREGGAFSFSRVYLRVSWNDFEYDICGAKFADGFFISWWLHYKDTDAKIFISRIPFVGNWLVKVLYPITYFKIDTASIFMTYIQSSVLKVIDDISKKNGLRSLTESERKPILKDVFHR